MAWKLVNPNITNDPSYLDPRLSDDESKISSNTTSLAENIQQKGTTESVVFNNDGTIQKVQYKDSSGNVVREDTFTYTTNLITEVRTVGSSSTTYKYHLDTLETEVI